MDLVASARDCLSSRSTSDRRRFSPWNQTKTRIKICISFLPSPSDFYLGHTYQYFPEITRELGELKKVVFGWKVNKSLLGQLNPLGGLKKDYLNLSGDIQVTDVHGLVSRFTPKESQLESGKDVIAELTSANDQ